MEHPSQGALASTRAAKFYPPQFDPAQHILRKRVINSLLLRGALGRQTLLIEAQAGQGKSVLAAQFLRHVGAAFSWYQLGPEDGDTLALVAALSESLRRQLPGLRCDLLDEMLRKGELGAHETDRLASLLLGFLGEALSGPFYLVFDDVYLLDGFPHSLRFLSRLLHTAPPAVRFVLISRHPVASAIQDLLPPRKALVVGNASLALSRGEVSELFHDVLATPVSRKTVRTLQRVTEGWVMGLVLLGQALQEGCLGSGGGEPEGLEALTRTGSVLEYFREQVLARFPADLRRTVLTLSFLDRIPVELAGELGDVADRGEALRGLSQHNFFLRPLNAEGTEFVFHHLFGDCLREQARLELPDTAIREAHRRAARWYEGRGYPLEALRYHLSAEDFAAGEAVLKEHGVRLQANNRLLTLHSALARIPDAVVRDHAWLSYFRGVTQLDYDPHVAIGFLDHALEGFRRDADELGEILAMTQLLYVHLLVDSEFNRGAPYLARLQELFPRMPRDVDILFRIQAAQMIAAGHVWITCDLKTTDHYSTMALQWARQAGLENFVASIAMARISRCILGGDFEACARETDDFRSLLKSPRVSAVYKTFYLLVRANQLQMNGDFDNYEHERRLVLGSNFDSIVAQTICGPMFVLWDCDTALAHGRLEEALSLARQGLRSEHAGAKAHMRSMFFHYYALILAMQGRKVEALSAIEESLRLRAQVGGKLFVALNEMFIGAAYAQLGLEPEAEAHLELCLRLCAEIGQDYTAAAAHAYRATLRLLTRGEAAATQDAEAAVAHLKRHGYGHVFGWHPEVMGTAFRLAAAGNGTAAHARELAARRHGVALQADGNEVPLLRVHTFGGLELRLPGGATTAGNAFSEVQRRLISLLLGAPKRRGSQEQLQEALWPEGEPEKSRSKFDTLLSRLRQTLDAALGAGAGKRYLLLRKGVLALENGWVDADEFRRKAREGLHLAGEGAAWRAGNAFRAADRLWHGEFLAGMGLDPEPDHLRRELTALFLEMCRAWADLLSAEGESDEAARVAERGFTHDPTDQGLARVLYDLHLHADKPVRAQEVLARYRRALEAAEFPAEEVEELLEEFWADEA